MLDLGWGELLVIGVVALIVVGPRDLPGMFRALGRYTGRMRSMARDFQRAMNRAADESGLRDVTRDIRTSTSESELGLDAFDKVAKRVTTTLGSSPGKVVAAGATAAASNLIMNPTPTRPAVAPGGPVGEAVKVEPGAPGDRATGTAPGTTVPDSPEPGVDADGSDRDQPAT